MPEPNRVVIDRVDWKRVLPVLRLSSAFKHALQPGKLLVALVAVLAIHLSGTALDLIWGMFSEGDSPGVYESISEKFGQALHGLFDSVLAFDLGLGSVSSGVLGSLYGIFIALPKWAFTEHPWFAAAFSIDVVFVLAMASGILCRMSASQVCGEKLTTASDAVGYVGSRWVWYLLTPLMPALLIVVVGGVLALAGLTLFNIPGVDVVGALGYGLFLLLGFIIAVVFLLLLFALFLMPPALSVEGSDGFDAIARSFNYILFRPWQFGVYLLSALLYLAIVSVLVNTVANFAMSTTISLVEIGALGEGVSRHEQIVNGDPADEGGTIGVNAWIVARWLQLLFILALAILLSTLCCLQTQVYVLMRRSADGTPMDEYDGANQEPLWSDQASAETTDTDANPQREG